MSDQEERRTRYYFNVTAIPEEARKLLENYSGIPPDDVLPHVLSVRDKGFDIFSYPCIGQLRFLDNHFRDTPYYQRVVDRLRAGATYLDAGCCFAQEIRYLVSREGISSEQLYGFDIEPRFMDIGYDLFRDRVTLKATLMRGDLSLPLDSSTNSDLSKIKGLIDVVYIASVLHLFTWDPMIDFAKRLVELAKATPGTMIVGNQLGSLSAKEYPMPFGPQYRHNVQTMERFWDQVGEETGTRWNVEAETTKTDSAITENAHQSWAKGDPDMCMISFCATRQ